MTPHPLTDVGQQWPWSHYLPGGWECWADDNDRRTGRCLQPATHPIGLCDRHHQELTGQ